MTMRQIGTIRLDMPDGTLTTWVIERDETGRWQLSNAHLGFMAEGPNFHVALQSAKAMIAEKCEVSHG